MPSIHYRYGGSSIHRTFGCPAWRILADELPKRDITSPAAELGTALHEAMEDWAQGIDVEVGKAYNGITITQEHMTEKLTPAMDCVNGLEGLYSTDNKVIEQLMTLPDTDDAGGSVDLIMSGPKHTIVADYKFGDGHIVEAEGNKQLLFYAALAALSEEHAHLFTDDRKLVMAIIQPTMRDSRTLKTWEVDMSVLDDFINDVYTAISVSRDQDLDDNPTFEAGTWCTFCPAAAICPVKTGRAQEALRIDTKNPELVGSINEALLMADELDAWVKEVRKLAFQQAELGVQFEDFKLVAKRATRRWGDEDAAIKEITSLRRIKNAEAMPPKLMSPAQLEKLCKEKGVDFDRFTTYITNSSTGNTLAPRDDKRPEAVSPQMLAALAAKLS